MIILAIESSCDETAAALVKDGTRILNSSIATSSAMHERWGGIVPEVASRQQLKSILPVIRETLSQIPEQRGTIETLRSSVDALAVTVGPGLVGSLLIGLESAKALAMATGLPIIPVNHVLAHMYANFLISGVNQSEAPQIRFPAISLVVSGGHTELFCMEDARTLTWMGGTIDDAAGEAFDKTARLLGFGSGGGLAIQNAALGKTSLHDKTAHPLKLPRPMMDPSTFNVSFSGLKTAVMREWSAIPSHNQEATTRFAWEIQEAITDVLVAKTIRAVRESGAKSVLISGGVASNLRLREKFRDTLKDHPDVGFFCPPVSLCTDNAAYIGSYAYFRGTPVAWDTLRAIPDLSVEE